MDRSNEPRLGHPQQHRRPTIAGRARSGIEPPAIDPDRVQAILDADKPK
jgi:hypothetical protein